MTSAQAKVTKIHLKHCVQKLAEAEMNLTRIARAATGIGNIFVLYSKLYFTGCYFSWSPCVSHECRLATGVLLNIDHQK